MVLEQTIIKYNLQFFANDEGGEKTEEPTAKKIEDSRKEGQVAKSKELSSACSLFALFLCLKIFIGFLGQRLVNLFYVFWRETPLYVRGTFDSVTVWQILLDVLVYFVITCVPFLLVAFIVAFVSQKVQIKWKVTGKPLQPKLSKLNPMNGLRECFQNRHCLIWFYPSLKLFFFLL